MNRWHRRIRIVVGALALTGAFTLTSADPTGAAGSGGDCPEDTWGLVTSRTSVGQRVVRASACLSELTIGEEDDRTRIKGFTSDAYYRDVFCAVAQFRFTNRFERRPGTTSVRASNIDGGCAGNHQFFDLSHATGVGGTIARAEMRVCIHRTTLGRTVQCSPWRELFTR